VLQVYRGGQTLSGLFFRPLKISGKRSSERHSDTDLLPLNFFYAPPCENLFFRLLSLARKLECWKVGFVKTTLDLPEDLVREMKLRAVHEGRKLREVATEIFRRGLAQPCLQTAGATQPSVIQNRVKLPLIQCLLGTPKFNLTPEEIDQILLEQEMKRFNEACGH
jgi:hypothetical protein